jgi:UDP-hydrolysing UDP-N-acetyl-D-glucosamine 2-epimerase
MGEKKETIHLTGCPAIDLVAESDLALPDDLFKRTTGVGDELTTKKDYIIVLQHPVTTEFGSGFKQIQETLEAAHKVSKTGMQIVWLWPNVDAGSDDISKGIRMFRDREEAKNMHFYKNFTPEDYVLLLANARCIVGNSSSGLREGAFLGTPCVNIGTRQSGRERAANVIDVKCDANEIKTAIDNQLKHGRYESSHLVGDGTAGTQIANILATSNLKIQKQISYVSEDSKTSE